MIMGVPSGYNEEAYWDPSLFPLPQNGSLSFAENYPLVSLGPATHLPFENATARHILPASETINPHSQSHSQSHSHSQPNTNSNSLDWPNSIPAWPSSSIKPIRSQQNADEKILLEPSPQLRQPKRRKRKPPLGEALERRRQQNRAAQLAFRERSKRQMEELRQELNQCVEYNQKMYSTMRELLDRTDSLKRDIEMALTSQPPLTLREFAQGETTQGLELELHGSPEESEGSLG